eukprot:511000_1
MTTTKFGAVLQDVSVDKFYHGIGEKLVFPELMRCQINFPLSTSSSWQVGFNFANNGNGLIIEFGDEKFNFTKCFSTSWVSDYPMEKEYLFLRNPGRLKIHNIYDAVSGTEYDKLIIAMTKIDELMRSTNWNVTTNDDLTTLINDTIKHQLSVSIPTSQYNSFDSLDKYAGQMIDTYFKNQNYMHINYSKIHSEYSFLKWLFYDVVDSKNIRIKLNLIHSLYSNTQIMSLENIKLCSATMDYIYGYLKSIQNEKHYLRKISLVGITDCSPLSVNSAVEYFARKFNSINYKVEADYKHDNCLCIEKTTISDVNADCIDSIAQNKFRNYVSLKKNAIYYDMASYYENNVIVSKLIVGICEWNQDSDHEKLSLNSTVSKWLDEYYSFCKSDHDEAMLTILHDIRHPQNDMRLEAPMLSTCEDVSICKHAEELINEMTNYPQSAIGIRKQCSTELILNNFLHCIEFHDGNDEFEYIYTSLGNCAINCCESIKRNYRDRGNENNDIVVENKLTTYEQVLDKIHCYYYHCYEHGHRLTKDERYMINSVEIDIENTVDYTLNKQIVLTNQIIKDKIKKLNLKSRINSSKFMPSINNTEHNEQKIFSFGSVFCYDKGGQEPRTQNITDDNFIGYVEPAYSQLKQELTQNAISSLNIAQYRTELQKAVAHQESYYYKKYYYKRLPRSNILAILIYCNYDTFQREFSKTYRKMTANETKKSIKSRHSHFWHLGKCLLESVSMVGTTIGDKIFYHGIGEQLIFPSTVDRQFIHSPLSTTGSFAVAVNFTNNNNGIIVEFGDGIGFAVQMPVGWLSDYVSESEHFFIGGQEGLKIKNITIAAAGAEYNIVLMSLDVIYDVLTEMKPTDDIAKNVQWVSRTLIKYRLLQYNNLHEYAKRLTNQFFDNVKEIHINCELTAEFYTFLIDLLLVSTNDCIELETFVTLFPHLTTIFIEEQYNNKNDLNRISRIISDLRLLNQKKNMSNKLIQLKIHINAKLSNQSFQQYQCDLTEIGFVISYEEKDKQCLYVCFSKLQTFKKRVTENDIRWNTKMNHITENHIRSANTNQQYNVSEMKTKNIHQNDNKNKPKILDDAIVLNALTENSEMNQQHQEYKFFNEQKQNNLQNKKQMQLSIEQIHQTLYKAIMEDLELTYEERKTLATEVTKINNDLATLVKDNFLISIHRSLDYSYNGNVQCSYLSCNGLFSLCTRLMDQLNSYKGPNKLYHTLKLMLRTFHLSMKYSLQISSRCSVLFSKYLQYITFVYKKCFGLCGTQHISTVFSKWNAKDGILHKLKVFNSLKKTAAVCYSCGGYSDTWDLDEVMVNIVVLSNSKHILAGVQHNATERCGGCDQQTVLNVTRRDLSSESIIILDEICSGKFDMNIAKNTLQTINICGDITTYDIIGCIMSETGHHFTVIKHIQHANWIQFQTTNPHQIYRINESKIKKNHISALLIRRKSEIIGPRRLCIDIPLLGSNDEIKKVFYQYIDELKLSENDMTIGVGRMREILMQTCLNNLRADYQK